MNDRARKNKKNAKIEFFSSNVSNFGRFESYGQYVYFAQCWIMLALRFFIPAFQNWV